MKGMCDKTKKENSNAKQPESRTGNKKCALQTKRGMINTPHVPAWIDVFAGKKKDGFACPFMEMNSKGGKVV